MPLVEISPQELEAIKQMRKNRREEIAQIIEGKSYDHTWIEDDQTFAQSIYDQIAQFFEFTLQSGPNDDRIQFLKEDLYKAAMHFYDVNSLGWYEELKLEKEIKNGS